MKYKPTQIAMIARQVIAHNLTATAQPMTRLEYNQFRGWTVPEGEDPSDPGYLMNFGSHIAWWPAGEVDKAFMVLPPAPSYQQRVHGEHMQLLERQEKLTTFITSPSFSSLVPAEQIRLSKQFHLQKQLLEVLNQRIASF